MVIPLSNHILRIVNGIPVYDSVYQERHNRYQLLNIDPASAEFAALAGLIGDDMAGFRLYRYDHCQRWEWPSSFLADDGIAVAVACWLSYPHFIYLETVIRASDRRELDQLALTTRALKLVNAPRIWLTVGKPRAGAIKTIVEKSTLTEDEAGEVLETVTRWWPARRQLIRPRYEDGWVVAALDGELCLHDERVGVIVQEG